MLAVSKPYPWELPEPGRNRLDEALRKVLRARRNVPAFGSLREQGMLIGKGVSAMNGVHLDARFPWLLEIGRDTGLSVGVMVLTHDSSTRRQTGYTRIARVKIGERVYIGAHAIVLPGTTIGDDVIVAAGAIVRGEIPAGAVVAGVPARQVGTTEEYTRVHMEGIENGPAWSVDDWPFSGAVPIEKQRAMLDALGDGVGYVGRPLRPTSKVAAPGDS